MKNNTIIKAAKSELDWLANSKGDVRCSSWVLKYFSLFILWIDQTGVFSRLNVFLQRSLRRKTPILPQRAYCVSRINSRIAMADYLIVNINIFLIIIYMYTWYARSAQRPLKSLYCGS